MKTFHKDYTKAELKIIIKSWNKNFRIYTTGKTKTQLADELDKYLLHDKDGEIQYKEEDDIQIADIDDFRKQKKDIKEKKKVEKERSKPPPVLSDEKIKKSKPRRRNTAAPSPSLSKSQIKKMTDTELANERAEKERSRIHSYSNTDATASLPNEMLKLIYNFLPPGVRDRVEEGTDEERDDLKFRRKFKELMKEKESIENLPKKITVKEKTQKYLELLSKLNEAVRLQKIKVEVYTEPRRNENEEKKLQKLYDEIMELEDIKSVKKALYARQKSQLESQSIQERDPARGGLY